MSHSPDPARQAAYVAFEDDVVLDEDGWLQRDNIDPAKEAGFGVGALFPTVTPPPAPSGSKTAKFTKKLKNANNGGLMATLDDAAVTVTKMTESATGNPFLLITFNYYVTSHGFRSGLGLSAGEPPLTHGLFFKNDEGGAMFQWGFPNNDLVVKCDWNRKFRSYTFQVHDYIDWFDIWNRRLSYRVDGGMYEC